MDLLSEEGRVPSSEHREYRLEKLRVGLSTLISEDLLYDMDIDVAQEIIHQHIRVSVTGNILKLGKGRSMTIEYPEDWWQAFKDRWFPDWALRRWPVRYKEHRIKAEALFPEASQRLALEPNLGVSYITLFEDNRGWHQ